MDVARQRGGGITIGDLLQLVGAAAQVVAAPHIQHVALFVAKGIEGHLFLVARLGIGHTDA